jgi:excisionase family DNA binding protein
MDKRLFTREEAADYCGLNYYKIAKAVREDRLPAKRHGRDILIDRADLDAFIDQMEVA